MTVVGVDDTADDGDQVFTVLLQAATSGDPLYSGFDAADVTATNSDDDAAGVIVDPVAGLVTTEAGLSATFTVALASTPADIVTITVATSDGTEGVSLTAALTFTPANALIPQTVTVTGQNDALADGPIAYTINMGPAASLLDPTYDGFVVGSVSLTNADDETAGVTVTPSSGLTVTEGGSTATFAVVLNAAPTANVTIGVSSTDGTEGLVSVGGLTFTPASAFQPQTVTVTGLNDSTADGDVLFTISTTTASSADPAYNNLAVVDVSVTNSDDDAVGILVAPLAGLTSEGGATATFTVRLASTPTADVTVGLTLSDGTEASLTPAGLTFSAVTAFVPQTVTVTGLDDTLVDGDVSYTLATDPAVSGDPAYSGFNGPDATLVNRDDDRAGVTVTPLAGLVVTEGAGDQATFTVVLDATPSGNVTIPVQAGDPSEVVVGTGLLTFTPSGALVPQTVTVRAADDKTADGDVASQVILSGALSSDAAFAGIDPADVGVVTRDDDAAGVLVSPTSGLFTGEAGGTATFTVVLTSVPTAQVTIGVSSQDTSEGQVAPGALVFTPGDALVPQTVTVTGADDATADGSTLYVIKTLAAISGDAVYSGLDPSDVFVTNTDDETPGITVSNSGGLVTTEGGGLATFTVVLDTVPTADVTLTLTSSDTTEATVAPAVLTFTAADALDPQTVTVTGADDVVIDGDAGYTIRIGAAASGDVAYSGLNPTDVSGTNRDDDVAGFAIAPLGGLTVNEDATTATFTVALTSTPLSNVSVPVATSDASEGSVSAATLTFTPGNALIAQTITVTGVDDGAADGAVAFAIVLGDATSTDPAYSQQDPADVGATNLDNETAGITVSPTAGLTVDESGTTATFIVVLMGPAPTANVDFTLRSSDASEATVNTISLTFTPGNAFTPQTVTITGVDDSRDDGDVTLSVVLDPVTSADAAFNGLDPRDVQLRTSDDDGVGITVSPVLGLTTTEAGGTATFTVRLDTLPTANVTVPLATSDASEGLVGPVSLLFTPISGLTAQTVTITGQDDLAQDGAVDYSIVVGPASSGDASYDDLNAIDVSVTNSDVGDTAGVTVNPTAGLTTTESGGIATFSVVLDTTPLADVTIAIGTSDSSEGSAEPAQLVFTPADGLTAKVVTVRGADDTAIDGDVAYTITVGAAASADAAYAGVDPSDVSVTNEDDDAPAIIVAPTGNLFVSEAGGTATFVIVLDTTPTANVIIGLTSNDLTEGTVVPGSLTFTPTSALVPQTVTVTGVNDSVDDGDSGFSIVTAAAVSGDPAYDTLNAADVGVINTDDDQAQILVSPLSGLSTSEALNGTATFTIVLGSTPTSNVTIGLGSSDATEGTLAVALVTFTPGNAFVAQTVTVTGADDAVEDGDVGYRINVDPAVTADFQYTGLDAGDPSLVNVDDENIGVFDFGAPAIVVNEDGATIQIQVTRTNGSGGQVTVDFATADESAQAGFDYLSTSGTLTFPDGVTQQTIVIPLIDDVATEQLETLNVNLTNPGGGAALGQQTLLTVGISDQAGDVGVITTLLEAGSVGSPLFQPLAVSDGGSGAFDVTVDPATVPPGVTIVNDGRELIVVGVPQTAGTFTIGITIADEGRANVNSQSSVTITIGAANPAAPPEVVDAGLPTGAVGSSYEHVLTAVDGQAPYTWAILSGTLPQGLFLDATTGRIAGTPQAAGTVTLCVQVTDQNAATDPTPTGACVVGEERVLTIVPNTLVITTLALPGGSVNALYRQPIEVAGGVGSTFTWTLSAGALPTGLTLAGTGRTAFVSGTPTDFGTFAFTVQAADDNQAGVVDTQAYQLTVAPEGTLVLAVTSADIPVLTEGALFTANLTAVGGTGAVTWAVAGGVLPTGLVLDPATGQIAGTPTAGGTFLVELRATDGLGATVTQRLTVNVAGGPALITDAPAAVPVGQGVFVQLEGFGGAGVVNAEVVGGTVVGGTFTGGGLPAGLSLSLSSGAITGTTNVAPGDYPVTIRVTDQNGVTTQQQLTITVVDPALGVTVLTRSLPQATVGEQYVAVVEAAGGALPYGWVTIAGTLPAGLTLDPVTGLISGVPTAAGTANLQFRVTEDGGATDDSALLQLAVVDPLQITTPFLVQATQGSAYSQLLLHAGGQGAVRWALVDGTLPLGLLVDATTGELRGVPTEVGTFDLFVGVTDVAGNTAQKSFVLQVNAPPVPPPAPPPPPPPAPTFPTLAITTQALPNGALSQLYIQQLAATGGQAPLTWAVIAGSLPPQVVLDPATGTLSGVIDAAGTFSITIQVASNDGQTAFKDLTITVPGAAVAQAPQLIPVRGQGSRSGCSLSAEPEGQPWSAGLLALLLFGLVVSTRRREGEVERA